MFMPSGKQPASGPFARAISAEIHAAMASHRISASKMASHIGVSKNYLSKRLRDEVPLTLNDIEAVCAVMGEDLLALVEAALRRMERDNKK